jgi:hypothetical protein
LSDTHGRLKLLALKHARKRAIYRGNMVTSGVRLYQALLPQLKLANLNFREEDN